MVAVLLKYAGVPRQRYASVVVACRVAHVAGDEQAWNSHVTFLASLIPGSSWTCTVIGFQGDKQ